MSFSLDLIVQKLVNLLFDEGHFALMQELERFLLGRVDWLLQALEQNQNLDHERLSELKIVELQVDQLILRSIRKAYYAPTKFVVLRKVLRVVLLNLLAFFAVFYRVLLEQLKDLLDHFEEPQVYPRGVL